MPFFFGRLFLDQVPVDKSSKIGVAIISIILIVGFGNS